VTPKSEQGMILRHSKEGSKDVNRNSGLMAPKSASKGFSMLKILETKGG